MITHLVQYYETLKIIILKFLFQASLELDALPFYTIYVVSNNFIVWLFD